MKIGIFCAGMSNDNFPTFFDALNGQSSGKVTISVFIIEFIQHQSAKILNFRTKVARNACCFQQLFAECSLFGRLLILLMPYFVYLNLKSDILRN